MSGPADLPSFDELADSSGDEPSGAASRPDGEAAARESAGPKPGDATGATAGGEPGGGGTAGGWATGELEAGRVQDLLETLGKGLRAHRLYKTNNQAYRHFLHTLQSAFSELWEHTSVLDLAVEDKAFRWGDARFRVGEGRDSLPFLFYKDGVRRVTFLPGFEDEVSSFLEVVTQAHQLDRQEDDLVTLLWEREFTAFEYVYVDILADGLTVPEAEGEIAAEPIDREQLEEEAGEAAETTDGEAEEADDAAGIVSTIRREDFEETLYFLDDAELDKLRAQVDEEWLRDVRTAALNALFDRLEDRDAERQREILEILEQLLTGFLFSGKFDYAITVLREVDDIASADVLEAARRAEVDSLLDRLSDPDVLGPLIQSLEDGSIDPDPEQLSVFLSHLRPRALPVLIRAAEAVQDAALADRLSDVIARLAGKQTEVTLELLESDEVVIARGAAKLVARLELDEAVPRLTALLDRSDASLRLAAVDALVAIHTGDALKALERTLADDDRDVRIAAARGIASLRYEPARRRLEEILDSRALRKADLTEQRAFFEAYGALGGTGSVDLLDGMLNKGGGLLRRRNPPELRACAALALGKIDSPAARQALEKAREASNPTVRTAVARALGGGGGE